jgi:O-antigen/teichoic acid export membrane protein
VTVSGAAEATGESFGLEQPKATPAEAAAAPAAAPATQGPPASTAPRSTTRSFVRGSTLLLAGRALSLALNFAAQVVIVRYLSKSDYGAFAYALGVATMGGVAVSLGLHKAVPRFLPLYRERGDFPRMFGAIALGALTVAGLGVSVALLAHGLQSVLLGRAVGDPTSLALLLVLIALTPIEALDHLLQGLLATFVGAKALFFRRNVLAPALRVAAVVVVVATAGDVRLLAYGYVIGGALGVLAYVAILVRTWQRTGLLGKLRSQGVRMPAREIYGYSFPLLSSELLSILKGSFVVVLLELLQSTTVVAEYRAILPVAKANLVVLTSFSLLYIPVASSLFAKGDREGIHDLFWQTTTWIAVLTFPLLAATTTLAEPLAVLLFGDGYASSGDVLAVLAAGFYFHAAFGSNTATLRVCGNVRYLVVTDVVTALMGVGMHVALIPPFGALGAAIATTSTLVLHNVLHHVGLSLGGTGVHMLEPRYLRVYGVVAAALLALLAIDRLAEPPPAISAALVLAASLAVLRSSRGVLRAETTFPELLRARWVRRFLG